MLNEVRIIGRLGGDPEIREMNGGQQKVCTVSVASWESYFDKNKPNAQGGTGEWQTITEWHRVVVWGDQTERLKKLRKGDMVLVGGKIRARQWDDKDGNKHNITEIIGTIKALPKTEPRAATAQAPTDDLHGQTSASESYGQPEEDDLPF